MAISSALIQTFQDFEIIVAEGASTDVTNKVVKAYIAHE